MYKIIQNNKVVDVVKDPYFITFLSTGHIAFTDKSNAKGIVGSDNKTLYSFAPNKSLNTITASIEKISREEFNRLQSLLNSSQKVNAEDSLLEDTKLVLIRRLSANCRSKIIAGFSITLSDGENYSFELTTEDQLNLMLIENQIASGAETFVYHATNQPCKVFVRKDMLKIVEASRRHILYHTTYFNAAKHYIDSLTSIEEVNLFTYGTDISGSVKDKTIRQILKNGGVQ